MSELHNGTCEIIALSNYKFITQSVAKLNGNAEEFNTKDDDKSLFGLVCFKTYEHNLVALYSFDGALKWIDPVMLDFII